MNSRSLDLMNSRTLDLLTYRPLGSSSWAEFLGRMAGHRISPHHTSHIIHISAHHTSFTSFTSHHITHHKPKVRKSTSFFMKTPFKSIPEERKVRELPPEMNVQEVEEPKGRKSTSFIVKTSLRSIRDQRKVRELPRKMNIEEVEEPKKYENYHAKPVSDPFKSTADTRKVRELPRKMNIEEVEEPETTKIRHVKPVRAGRDTIRKCVNSDKTRTCKHESTKIATNSVRHLDLATRPFTITVRTLSVNHTVWGIKNFFCRKRERVLPDENIFRESPSARFLAVFRGRGHEFHAHLMSFHGHFMVISWPVAPSNIDFPSFPCGSAFRRLP